MIKIINTIFIDFCKEFLNKKIKNKIKDKNPQNSQFY